jgi:hypothetical protein
MMPLLRRFRKRAATSNSARTKATAGTREAPVKLTVEKSDKGFVMPAPPTGQWIIIQYKETAEAKAVIARLHYNTKVCEPYKQPEWRCACGDKE